MKNFLRFSPHFGHNSQDIYLSTTVGNNETALYIQNILRVFLCLTISFNNIDRAHQILTLCVEYASLDQFNESHF